VLVNAANAGSPTDVYDFLVAHDFYFHQYIPCVEWDRDGNLAPFAITGREWGDFLCGIFDRWVQHSHEKKVSIRHFDSILEYLVHGTKNVCIMGTDCNSYFLIEHNGDVYPCDFFAEPDLKIGNIHNHDWRSLQESNIYRNFGLSKGEYHQACEQCEFVDLCQGDCTKHRYRNRHTPMDTSWLCDGWKNFYRHTLERFNGLAEELKKAHIETEQPRTGYPSPAPGNPLKIGRNAPCPCGSGKKYKRCCGRS